LVVLGKVVLGNSHNFDILLDNFDYNFVNMTHQLDNFDYNFDYNFVNMTHQLDNFVDYHKNNYYYYMHYSIHMHYFDILPLYLLINLVADNP
jgi:hypothetical protein